MFCTHILRKGPRKGQHCNKQISAITNSNIYCQRHVYINPPEHIEIIYNQESLFDFLNNEINLINQIIPENLLLIENQNEKKQCSYIFKKGKNKGLQCSVKSFNCFCSKHSKNLSSQFLIKPSKKIRKDFPDVNDCVVCYEKNDTFTKCKHNLCSCCLNQLRKTECPMCRQQL
jgi:hypothetical protein